MPETGLHGEVDHNLVFVLGSYVFTSWSSTISYSKTDYRNLHFTTCSCFLLPQILVEHGLFPASPSQPCIAVSIDLLEFYRALFEHSCDAIKALASALNSFYTRRGFQVVNKKVCDVRLYECDLKHIAFQGEPIQDAFRRSLGSATQWYDCLRIRVEGQVDAAVEAASQQLQFEATEPQSPSNFPGLSRCSRVLQQRCPACFAGIAFGRPFNQ
jgi:hypothetical protein